MTATDIEFVLGGRDTVSMAAVAHSYGVCNSIEGVVGNFDSKHPTRTAMAMLAIALQEIDELKVGCAWHTVGY